MSRARVSAAVRAVVEARAGGCCEYCRAQLVISSDPFPIDHIMPAIRGGSSDPSNLALACHGCNGRKHAAVTHPDPATGEPVPIFNPRTARWTDHFTWSADFEQVRPLTSTGRATVDRLALNRPGLMNQRRMLRVIGRHPPP